MYSPLPKSLTIKQSKINGLGLFAIENIDQGTNLGMSHVKLGEQIIRTPLGGFINHRSDANCVKVSLHANGTEPPHKRWNLVTIKDIEIGDELTLRYTFYHI